jgi:hypothetical protein
LTFKWGLVIIAASGVCLWTLMFVFMLRSAYHIYRTGRYAYKDLSPWIARFKEMAEKAQSLVESIGNRGGHIAAEGEQIRSTVEEIADVASEISNHPYVKAARIAGKIAG